MTAKSVPADETACFSKMLLSRVVSAMFRQDPKAEQCFFVRPFSFILSDSICQEVWCSVSVSILALPRSNCITREHVHLVSPIGTEKTVYLRTNKLLVFSGMRTFLCALANWPGVARSVLLNALSFKDTTEDGPSMH